jgi:hypothetical protein
MALSFDVSHNDLWTIGTLSCSIKGDVLYMQRKVFWVLFIALGLIADFILPLMWAIIATVPIFILSWWVAYRSEWFG